LSILVSIDRLVRAAARAPSGEPLLEVVDDGAADDARRRAVAAEAEAVADRYHRDFFV
jgi:hypothetical protein